MTHVPACLGLSCSMLLTGHFSGEMKIQRDFLVMEYPTDLDSSFIYVWRAVSL